MKAEQLERAHKSVKIHLKTRKLNFEQLKEERLRAHFAGDGPPDSPNENPLSPLAKAPQKGSKLENINISGYSIKISSHQPSRNLRTLRNDENRASVTLGSLSHTFSQGLGLDGSKYSGSGRGQRGHSNKPSYDFNATVRTMKSPDDFFRNQSHQAKEAQSIRA